MEGSILASAPHGSSFGLKGKSKEWQMEMLMEKLRSKSSQFKSFYESSKALRMTMLEKRYPIDPTERSHLQKCLDTLQQNIKVTTLQAMIERLESVSRQLNLKFVTGPSGVDLFISSDMFYLEVNLDELGGIKDVKIHHEGQGGQQSCEELVSCLSRRDFADFTAQLEGLASIYQLNADKKVKCKAFTSLTSLEIDLTVLASLRQYSKDPLDQVQRSPVGHLEKRRGGHPMKLTYFVSPYELLDPQSQNRPIRSLPNEGPLKVGTYVSVCMESSSANKLQIQPLVTIGHGADGLAWPTYASISPNNSITVAGSFVLNLNKPMPICVSLINNITAVTKAPCADLTTTSPLLSLICQHAANGMDTQSSKGLFVNVDDQYHCYLMTESRGSLEGVVVSSIPFTHPSHVPEIISFLRRQAMFNCIISSCVRTSNKAVDFENMIMVEVSPLNWRQLTVSLEHPLEESMASVELDLNDPDNIQVKVFTSSSSTGQYSELATKVFQRCLSIPVTMRTLIKQWNATNHQQHRLLFNGGVAGGGTDPSSGGPGGDRSDSLGDGPPDLLDPEVTVKMEPGLGGLGQNGSNVMPNYGEMLSDQHSAIPDPVFDTAFSSSLDHDQTLGGISFGEMKSGLTLGNLADSPHKSRKKKRKIGDIGWHSPKRKSGEEGDSSGDDESTSLGTPTSREASDPRAGTPTSATSGLEFSSLADLENSVSGITGDEKTSDNELESVMMAATGELDDSDDVFKTKKKKRVDKERTANDILMDLENKNLVPPSVSITPIVCGNPPNFGSVLSGMGLDRRPGIEIIPITTSPPAPVPTSITITPIPKSSDERSKDRKKSRDGEKSGSKSTGEKKRKRKREESPMGPPEKLPPKNDPLSKRVTVSIEPAESSPLSPVSAMRKFTSSPTGGSSTTSPLGVVPKGSPGTSKSSKSSHQSPKHSPAYSPKNNLISSPKPGSSSSAGSPKSSSSSVGKPSLNAMKSAVSSPNKEKSKSSSSSKSSSDKSDRKSPKIKTSSVKSSSRSSTSSPGGGPPTGGGDGGGGADSAQSGGARPSAPSGSSDLGKASSSNSTSSSSSSRNRKGSLSAIVDKLKSAQATDELSITPSRDKDVAKKDRDKKVALGTTSTVELKPGTTPPPGVSKVDAKTGEYMVKPSSDGIKITINKTKTRDKLTKEKTHTGLKPGVNSGPISKKPSTSLSSGVPKSGTSGTSSGSSSSYKKKPDSLGSSGSKPTKDKLNKTSSAVKDKPPSVVKKDNAVFTVVETGLGKSLDTKFQIPKLSARTSITEKKTLSLRNDENPPPSPSPSVSVHIVPSLRLSPRPSPGVITEDDLMDEALVGGK